MASASYLYRRLSELRIAAELLLDQPGAASQRLLHRALADRLGDDAPALRTVPTLFEQLEELTRATLFVPGGPCQPYRLAPGARPHLERVVAGLSAFE